MSIQAFGGGRAPFKKADGSYEYVESWMDYVELLIPRYGHGVFVYNNRVYTVGGISPRGRPTSAVEWFDTRTMEQGFASSMPEPLAHFAYAYVNDKFYVIGGVGTDAVPRKTIYSYDPANDSWSQESYSLLMGLAYNCATVYNNKIYVIGGVNDSGDIIGDIYVVDPSNGTVSHVSATLSTARQNHTCATLNGKIYVLGGDNGSQPLASTEIYDPVSNTVSPGPDLPYQLTGLSSTILEKDGKQYIILIGG